MQCNCGGVTIGKKETKNYKIVATWDECRSCGRVVNVVKLKEMTINEMTNKSCPFCGKIPTDEDKWFGSIVMGKWGFVECCGQGPDIRAGYRELKDWKQEALNAWNQRDAWVKVSERLPEFDKISDNDTCVYVLGYNEISGVSEYQYSRSHGWRPIADFNLTPTHWQYMPDAPIDP